MLASRADASHRERVAALAGFAALSPVLRTLLTTDGTVTETLAAFFGEDVGVRVLDQGHRPLADSDADLEAPSGARVLDRTIVLAGARSGSRYTAARSRIVPDRLPAGLRDGLLAGREPLGKLMLLHRLETFREVTACGRGAAGDAALPGGPCAEALGVAPEAPVVWRTYRVVTGARPAMVITEFFPESLFPPESLE
jgi:chorismate-pyruvate lyase